MDRKEYDRELKELQKEIASLVVRATLLRRSLILVFEGVDAAGKGGAIKRLLRRIDPELFRIFPISAPSTLEKNHNYLWRFWQRIPEPGGITLFDRSWYGRLLVERVEGFARDEEWQRAYGEIRQFERTLHNWGYGVAKFWLQVDYDEQWQRFEARRLEPHKQWKLTEEDYRNRDKWSQYKQAVDDMFSETSSDFAPWHMIEANDKLAARLEVLRHAIAAMRRLLERSA